MTLALSNLVVAGISNARVFVTLSKPDGSVLYNRGECWTNGTGNVCEIALLNLPQSGTYTVNVAPDSVSQTMNFGMTVSTDVTGVLTSGTPLPVTLNAMGQSALLSFTATAGQTFALNLAGLTTLPANTPMVVTVYNSANSVVGNPLTTSSTLTTLNLQNLAADTYKVLIHPSIPATSTVQVTLVPQAGGTLAPDGTTVNIGTTVPGQNAYFSFWATAGQSLSLTFSNVNNGGATILFNVFEPNGIQYNVFTIGCSDGSPLQCVLPMPNLPQSGTYRVEVAPNSSSQTMSFKLTLSADVAGVLTSGTALPVTLGAMGQNAMLSFTATAGQTFALNLAGLTTVPANTSMIVTVLSSFGATVGSPLTTSDTVTTLNLPNLAADTYQVLISPRVPATASMQVTLQPQAGGSLAPDGTSMNVATAVPGQNAYFSFSGRPVRIWAWRSRIW